MTRLKDDKSWTVKRINNTSNGSSLKSDTETDQKNRSIDQQGFTLLEVMIALAIVATVLVALLGLQTRTINMGDRQQKITQATMLAQERMTVLEIAAGKSSTSRDDEGAFAEPFENYRWQVRYKPTPLAAVQEVTVTVIWGNEANNEDVALTSFLFR